MVLSWIIFKTNYQDEYQGLKRNECYFSYSVVENECNLSRKKLQRILLDLEVQGFITWIHKSKAKDTKSVIFLIETGYGSENGSGYGLGYGKTAEKTNIKNNKDTVKDTSSKNISKNISNNIYSHWNSKKIIVHKALNKDVEKAIEKALKKYSESEIVQAIDTYSEILKSGFYFNYKWSLTDFINRKNGISTFMEDGSNKINYGEHLAKQSKERNSDNEKVKEVHLRGWD